MDVVDVLSKVEIDRIASVADNMYPKVVKTASATPATEADKSVHSGPAIVMASKEVEPINPVDEMANKLHQ